MGGFFVVFTTNEDQNDLVPCGQLEQPELLKALPHAQTQGSLEKTL